MVILTLIPIPLNVVAVKVAFGVRRILPVKKKFLKKSENCYVALKRSG